MGWLDGFFKKPKQQIKEVVTPDRAVAWRKLQESFNSQPDLFASLMDRYFSGGEWWQPVSGIPMLGGTSNREHGRDTYGGFYTEQDLRFQRDAARLLFAREPVAKAIEGHLNAFVIGKGMSYKICPKKDFTDEYNTPEGEKRLRQYQQAIDDWLDEQQWPEREQECYTCKVVDGEFFLWVTMRAGKVTVRRLEPEHIQNPEGKTYLDGWYLGVKIDLKDAETPLAYGYKPDGVAWQEIPTKQIIHFKANVTRNVSRGISDFYPVTDDLKSISQLLDNIRDGAMARAEIAYMWSVKNATPAAISAFADDKADRSWQNSVTRKTELSKGQRSGKAVAHGDNVEFTTMPQGDVEGSVAALQASLRMVGNRFCMPEYMVSADASNANYSSTQMAGTPFVRKVEIEQSLLKRPFKQILTMVMEQAVVKGIIPTSEFAKLDIEIECGSPVIEDEYQQAQMFDIMRRNGVISPQKWCMAKGLDYEEVQRDLNEWNESNMQAPDLGGNAVSNLHQLQLSRRYQQQDKQNEYDAQQNEPVKEGYEDSYGRCPICGGECKTRERRINGYDTCVNGHKYLSRDAVHEPVQENVLDSSGHLHKGKGVGGGQFTGKVGIDDFKQVLNVKKDSNVHAWNMALGFHDTCSRCAGSGQYSYNAKDGTKCFKCGGSGKTAPKLTPQLLADVKGKVADGTQARIIDENKRRNEAKKWADGWYDEYSDVWGSHPVQKAFGERGPATGDESEAAKLYHAINHEATTILDSVKKDETEIRRGIFVPGKDKVHGHQRQLTNQEVFDRVARLHDATDRFKKYLATVPWKE